MKTLVLENFGEQEIEKEVINLIKKDPRFNNHEFWFHFHESYWPENREETLKRLNTLQSGDNILCATAFDGFLQLEIMINILHEFIKQKKSINFYIDNSSLEENFIEFLNERESTLSKDEIAPSLKKKEKEKMNKKFHECLEFHNIYRYNYLSEGPVLIKSKDLLK
jgi:hypothetical protein